MGGTNLPINFLNFEKSACSLSNLKVCEVFTTLPLNFDKDVCSGYITGFTKTLFMIHIF